MKESVSGCHVEDAIRVLGGRWRIVLVYSLLDGPKRFNELRREMPKISQRMLTLDLRALEAAGLVFRTIYPEVPVRVVYELTQAGHALRPLVEILGDVGESLQHLAPSPVRNGAVAG
ncbi:HxlR family transcriptional regulator [Devosia geojensis]|uniref:HxlR family transcriptional regulator n=1 Tax=Devosia geojensis TaxID=443610 RepID=A0A0F5FSI6_9HYPH|nr:helix-turn-helix domain-containing protein [Devosia geojensis]KKB11122.1 HxlR family transcriptional regulator [Devosia geojensis]